MSKVESANVNCGGCFGCLSFILLVVVMWVLFFGGTLTIMGHVIKAHCC